MSQERTFSKAYQLLRDTNLRPTKQRLGLCQLLFENGNRHVKAETLHAEAAGEGISVSLATVYNTLHQLTDAGLLRQIHVDGASTYFDTNLAPHGHYYLMDKEELTDVPGPDLDLASLPAPPEGTEVAHVEVIVRLKESRN